MGDKFTNKTAISTLTDTDKIFGSRPSRTPIEEGPISLPDIITYVLKDVLKIDSVLGRIGVGRDPTTKLDVYNPSGDSIIYADSVGGVAGLYLNNSLAAWRRYISSSTGHLLLKDQTTGTFPVVFELGCPSNLLYLNSDGRVYIGGAFAIGSGGRLTVTTGTYNGLDVTDTGMLILNPGGGNITINDLAGGATGQSLFVIRGNSANTVSIVYASGSNQAFRTYTEATINSTVPFSDIWMYDGSVWGVGGGTV